jgi:phospholipid/cholesterol/gamma-HCH transport system substrate-binding protein
VSRRKEIQVGLTVLVALAILIWSLAWLKEYQLNAGQRVWTVQFPEAGGLAESDEVQVNGIRKGNVRSMKLVGDKVIVELNLANDIVVTRDSRVAIRNVGLMGEKVIAVELRATGAPYRPGEVIPGEYEKDMGQMMGEMAGTIESVRGLSEHLENVAAMLEPRGSLARTIENFQNTSEELHLVVSENRASVRETMKNFSDASRTARNLTTGREAELARAIDRFSAAAEKMDVLATRLDSLRTVIHTVAQKVEGGEGTLGKMVNDDQLYAELNASVKSMKALIEDVKAHPKKYFKFSVF